MVLSATLLLAGSLSVIPVFDSLISPNPASAAEGDGLAKFEVTNVRMLPTESAQSSSPLAPGDTFTYEIDISCSGTIQGGDSNCRGAVFEFTGLTFQNIFGNTQTLDYVTGSLTATPGGDAAFVMANHTGGVFNVVATDVIKNGTVATVQFKVKVPLGTVPVGTHKPVVEGTVTQSDQFDGDKDPTAIVVPDPTIKVTGEKGVIAKSPNKSEVVFAPGVPETVTYTITVSPDDQLATHSAVTVIDTLPLGASLVSSSIPPTPVPTETNSSNPNANTTLTWVLDSAAVQSIFDYECGCFKLQYSVSYPASGADSAHNEVGQTKTNTVDLWKETDISGVPGYSASANVKLVPPPVSIDPSKAVRGINGSDGLETGEYYVTAGDKVAYLLGFTNSSHEAAGNFTKVVIVDPLQEGFQLEEIRTGTWDGSVTPSVEISADNSTWYQVSTTPSQTITDTSATGLGIGAVRYIRWSFDGTIAPGWTASGQQLRGVITAGDSLAIKNCLNVNATHQNPSNNKSTTNEPCSSLYRDGAVTPHPHLFKSTPVVATPPIDGFTTGLNEILPGQTVTYQLALANVADATGNLVNPVLTDCVPNAEYLSVSNFRDNASDAAGLTDWTRAVGTSANLWATECLDEGGTPLQFTYTGTFTPGQAAPTIFYDVTAKGFFDKDANGDDGDPTPPGEYKNTVALTSVDTPIKHCTTTKTPGNGSLVTNEKCETSHTVTVPAFTYLESVKMVKGALDGGWNRAGVTTPGGQVQWELTVRNVGNVPAGNVTIIDILPHFKDRHVRQSSVQRGSEYGPILTSPVSAEGWTVEYSTSANPCRKTELAMVSESSGCVDGSWISVPNLAALSTYKSLRFKYVGINEADTNPAIDVGTSVTFTFNMATPVADPSYDNLEECTVPLTGWNSGTGLGWNDLTDRQAAEPTCPVAYNSFGYGVTPIVPEGQAARPPLGAEPDKVAVHVIQPMSEGEPEIQVGVGDRVWFDPELDGIQEIDEDGNYVDSPVPGIRVELFEVVDGQLPGPDATPLNVTFTDTDGLYLFTTDANLTPLLPGDYVVRFYPPAGYEVSPQQQGSDSAVDSDPPNVKTGTNDIGNYHDTRVITLVEGIDRTWDMGIWGGDEPAISIDKVTKDSAWDDALADDGVYVAEGRPVTWIYTITNTGTSRLTDVTLGDLETLPGNQVAFTDDRFTCEITDHGLNRFDDFKLSSADPEGDEGRVLNRGAVMRCTTTGVAGAADYTNLADVKGHPTLDNGEPAKDKEGKPLEDITDDDPSSYFSVAQQFAVGDYVWFDNNRNGVQDSHEAGVPNVTVELVDADPDSETYGSAVQNTVTNSDGLYLFCNVPIGTYQVRFSNLPSGYQFTTQGAGSNPVVDSNPDNTGLTPPFEINVTAPNIRSVTSADFELYGEWAECWGEELGGPTLINPTIDAGIWLPTPPSANLAITKVAGVSTVKTGDIVTWTLMVSNSGTGSASNVVVADTLPAGLEFQAGTTGLAPTYNPTLREITWVLPTVAPGETITLDYTTLVTATEPGLLRNSVTIPGSPDDPDAKDDDEVEVEVDDNRTPPTTDPTTPSTDPDVGGDDANRDKLPHTGSNMGLFATLAAALTLLGGVMVGVSRRRRLV